MDRFERATSLVKHINQLNSNEIEDYEFVLEVCEYFDQIKDEEQSVANLQFLRYVSNLAGIPHYFDLLQKFSTSDVSPRNYDLSTISSLLFERTLYTDENVKVHKYQKQVIDHFRTGELNRFFLSASTSFGKTFLVYEIIKKMNYQNVVLIFPTIALLSENLERLI